ncbi:hypothetical protein CsSME_00053216 [Camellia sinensis var. sinensis]
MSEAVVECLEHTSHTSRVILFPHTKFPYSTHLMNFFRITILSFNKIAISPTHLTISPYTSHPQPSHQPLHRRPSPSMPTPQPYTTFILYTSKTMQLVNALAQE